VARITSAVSGAKTRPNTSGNVNGLPREAIEALPSAIYMTDAEGRITFYNEAAATLWAVALSWETASSAVLGSFIGRTASRCRMMSVQWPWRSSKSDPSAVWKP